MNKKIYLAGKVTGLPSSAVREKFMTKERELIQKGYDVVNPVRLVDSAGLHNETWNTIMRHCIAALVHCEEVHLLPCWNQSKGATMERDVAVKLGIKTVYH